MKQHVRRERSATFAPRRAGMRPLARRLGGLGAALAGMLALSACGSGDPAGPCTLPCTVATDAGVFRVTAASETTPISINQLHRWTLRVETAAGDPVEQARITIDGGMPEHRHGLPTVPRVTEDLGEGRYLAEGMKFSMPGLWELRFTVSGNGQTDQATVRLEL